MKRCLIAMLAVAMTAAASTAADYTATVQKVGALTGPDAPADMRAADICGTDIGTMAEIGGRIVMAFGDTFGWQGDSCRPFGPNWRSNVLAFTDDTDPSDGVAIDSWLADANGKAIAIVEGAHAAPFTGEGTRIPTAMVAVDDTLYLHTMSVHGFASMGGVWLCNSSTFHTSTDEGQTWQAAPELFGDFKSSFNMLALSNAAGAGNEDGTYVYAIGTPCGRFAGARAVRVPADKPLDTAAWEYFDGTGWVADRAQAAEVIKPGVGEGSLAWNAGIGQWMYTTLNEPSAAIELRLAPLPQGPWSEPITLASGADYAALYGAFLTQSWISEDGLTFYFLMSQFGPYNVYVMKAELAPA